MNYTQKIYAVDILPEVDGLSNVIVRVKWEYRAQSGVNVVWNIHTTELTFPNKENFISFQDITESMVLDWIAQQVDLAALRENLDLQLQASIKDFVEKDPPWETPGDNVLTRSYIMVHEGSVVWGPTSWNTAGINYKLENLGLSVVLPNVVPIIPETQPLVIGTETFIYRVKMLEPSTPRLIDRVIYDVDDISWDFSSGIAVGQIQYDVKPLEGLKTSVVDWLRGKRVFSGHRPIKNTSIDDIIQLAKMSMFALSSDETVEWLDTDDMTIKTMSKSEFQEKIDGIVNEEKSADQEVVSKVAAVSGATTTKEILDFYNQWK